MSSGLTKHYYVVDEVRAALAYACKERNQDEAHFWCRELIVSHMCHLARETLFDTWFWTYGPCKLFWLFCISNCDLDRLPRVAQHLAIIDKSFQDSSLWVILKETKEQPDRIVSLSSPPNDKASLQSYFMAAASEHKAACAWWAASQLGIDETFALALKLRPERASYLHIIVNIDLPGYDNAIHCLLACVASMWDDLFEKSTSPIPIGKEIALRKHSGPRQAREYAIQPIYLYGITERGKMKQSQNTLNNLRSIEDWLIGPYWTAMLKQVKASRGADGKIVWASEDSIEEFYEKHFPDDIPDEWSLADQMKSHGPGVLGELEHMNQEKFARIWLPRRQRLCWFQITSEGNELVEPLAAMALENTPVVSESDKLCAVKKVFST